jgi:hypothetical protein
MISCSSWRAATGSSSIGLPATMSSRSSSTERHQAIALGSVIRNPRSNSTG